MYLFCRFLTDEIEEQNVLQRLEDEECMSDLSECLEKTILNAKKGSIKLEIKIEAWNDVLSIIDEANSSELNDRVVKWLSQNEALTDDQIVATNINISFKEYSDSKGNRTISNER